MPTITTTLNRISAYSPCDGLWAKLLKGLGKTEADDEPLTYATILHIVGIDDALWCCRAEPQHASIWRKATIQFERRVQHLTTNPRSLTSVDVTERHAHELATDRESALVWIAARNAAWKVAGATTWLAAWIAAGKVALAGEGDTERAIAWVSARIDTWTAARDAEREAQTTIFLELVGNE